MYLLNAVVEFFHIVFRRIRKQGIRQTIRWFRAVGVPWLTGRISLRYSQITPNLYLGPQYGRLGMRTLQEAGVSASLNLRAEYDDKAYGLSFPEYSHLPIVDNTPPTIEQLDQAVAFIERVIGDNKAVYIHCGSGVGRAPTVVAAYLMAAEGLSPEAAIQKVTTTRPFIRVLPPQLERLYEYDKHLRVAPPAPAQLPDEPPQKPEDLAIKEVPKQATEEQTIDAAATDPVTSADQ